MTGGTVWEIQLEIRDGASAAFGGLMESVPLARTDAHGVPGRFDWSLADDGKLASIFLRCDPAAIATVCWAGDRVVAEAHLNAIAPDFARRLFAVARPINLVTLGDHELPGRDGIDGAALRPSPTPALSRRAPTWPETFTSYRP